MNKNFDNVDPLIYLDFAKSKRTSPIIATTRNSAGLVMQNNKHISFPANTPRMWLDNNNSLGGLVCDNASTNLFTYSSSYNSGAFDITSGSSISKLIKDTNYTVFVENSTNTLKSLRKFYMVGIANGEWWSVQARVIPQNRKIISIFAVLNFRTVINESINILNIDLATGDYTVNNRSGDASWDVEKLNDGSFIVKFSAYNNTGSESSAESYIDFRSSNSSTLDNFLGNTYDGTNGLECFGVTDLQFEKTKGSTSLIQTTTTQVSRAAEIHSIKSTEIAGLSLAKEGTIFIDYRGNGSTLWFIGDNTQNCIYMAQNGSVKGVVDIYNSGAHTARIHNPNIIGKTAFSYKNGEIVLASEFGGLVKAVANQFPNFSNIFLGSNNLGTNSCNGRIKQYMHYDKALSEQAMLKLVGFKG